MVTELRETLSDVHWFIIKDILTNDREEHQVQRDIGCSLEVSGAGASVPEKLGVPPSWNVDVSPTQTLSEPCIIGVFMKTTPHRHDRTLIPF